MQTFYDLTVLDFGALLPPPSPDTVPIVQQDLGATGYSVPVPMPLSAQQSSNLLSKSPPPDNQC